MTNKPNPFPECGVPGKPACAPQPAAGTNFTPEQMHEHGHANYQKGRQDVIDAVNAVLDDPGPAWGDGELARAVRKAFGE